MSELLESLSATFGKGNSADDQPVRAEIFSVERLEQLAQSLAAEHKVVRKKGRAQLLPRLEDNGRKLFAAYRTLGDSIEKGRAISPAAEWLVDNFHVVEEQLREIREDLPSSYYQELPKLAQGELKDYPRIYAVALPLIAHTDCRLDTATLRRYIAAYQTVAPLSIGELWAVAITLRLALVENLRRLAVTIVRAREEREQADKLADKILELAKRQPAALVPLISERFGKREKIPQSFLVQLTQRLREQDPAVMPVTEWLEKQLAWQATSIEQVIHAEHQRQAATQVTVGNIITSMRLLSTLDWRDFFESVSLIEPLLGADPAGAYSKMEFATRDRYRHVIERISKRTVADELEIARVAVEFAEDAGKPVETKPAAEPLNDGGGEPRAPRSTIRPESHVGYYLVDNGLAQLEASFAYRPRLGEKIRRFVCRQGTAVYLGTLALLTFLIIGFLVFAVYLSGLRSFSFTGGSETSWAILVLTALLSLIPASDLAVSILNWDITHLLRPRLLPRMETATGIPNDACTMVAVPTIFSSESQVSQLLEKLEVHFLANQDPHIYFALLGDFADADAEHLTDDSSILEFAQSGIAELNRRHSSESEVRFHLFHRRRLWNPSEDKWMGWERKRGKLEEFNRLLRGARDTSFIPQTANETLLNRIRYVITLDSDTQLPRDVARKLVGAAIHPLNRPQLNAAGDRVIRGYGIVQPRVSISLVSASRSRFAEIFSGNTGIDPYTTAVSDVYQDLFGEGNFTGKGLYDVDAFQQALDNRVPENSLLSHDLFESLFARAALVTDIELLDDYPASYDAYAKRQHRWTRGDWQILRWLFPTVPDAARNPKPNPLPLISRWKILDNLRRSLVAPSLFLWLLAAWTLLPGSPLLWSLFVVIAIAFPVYLHVTTSLLIHPRGIPWTSHFWSVWGDVSTNTAQVALSIIFLPHQAYLMCDAIIRTVYRKLISRKRLLEWVTAADAEKEARSDVAGFFRFMLPALLLTLVSIVFTLILRPHAWKVMLVFAAVWAISPWVGFWISSLRPPERKLMSSDDVEMARRVSRRTWRFFETFVGPEDNWLPPDNFQEDPTPVIAHRTSPTNIGLLQLATVSAHDLGYVASLEFLERQELTFAALAKLGKFRGHFFNWYDTKTLQPLQPQYISTVDSGNLAGHSIALKQACVELPDAMLFDRRIINGLGDTLNELFFEVNRLGAFRQRTDVVTVSQLRDEIETCRRLLAGVDVANLPSWFRLFASLHQRTLEIEDIINALAHEHGEVNFKELRWWLGSFQHQIGSCLRDGETLAPWGRLLLGPHDINDTSLLYLLQTVPTLADVPQVCDNALVQLAAMRSYSAAEETTSVNQLTRMIEDAASAAADFLARLSRMAHTAEQIMEEMDFKFLLDRERKVFTIGYNVSSQRADNSYYDLLASEARLASFVAIAKGDVAQEHWFRMGRQLVSANGGRALISWTGTMFEYLMPLLVMRDYPGTLLHETYRTVVARQIEYGRERGVPWGISESAFHVRDLQLNYQYGPFGVPGLGLKRGLIQDVVVAPYATMLAAEINPRAAMENLRRLEKDGALGAYGYYEAIDYTAERLPQDQERVLIRAFMTHHQGMSLVSLTNILGEDCMERRFHADPLVQATELLLQERIPVGVPAAHPRAEEVLTGRVAQVPQGMITRVYHRVDTEAPRTQLLSNGTYNVMVTVAGGGYSNCGANAVTRWREDVTRDNWGTFIYLRDVRSGAVWSASYQPVHKRPQSYEVAFSEDKADFWRTDAGITTHTEIVVSAEDNAEVRRVSLTNNSTRMREIELTSYAEVVLNTPQADAAHPAFSNLFIETEFFAAENAILAHRRQRASNDESIWGIHVVVVEGDAVGAVQYETDRGRFLGRGHTPADPVAVMEDRPLSNTTGAVLDPVFSLRRRVRIPPGQTVRCSFSTIVTSSREQATLLADKYHDPSTFERELRLAWTKAQVEISHLNIDAEEAHLFQRLAARVIYSDPSLRPRPHVLGLNTKAQSSLWAYGISGDLPILVVRIDKAADLPMVRKLVRGHEYLHYKGLKIDLVILNDNPTTYLQSLHKELETMIRTSGLGGSQDKPGGVFLRRTDQIPEADRILLHAVARAVIVCERGLLEDQLERPEVSELLPAGFGCAFTVAKLSRAGRCASGVNFLQRARRVLSGRSRVCDHSRRRAVDARAVVKHYRQQTRVWFSGE